MRRRFKITSWTENEKKTTHTNKNKQTIIINRAPYKGYTMNTSDST